MNTITDMDSMPSENGWQFNLLCRHRRHTHAFRIVSAKPRARAHSFAVFFSFLLLPLYLYQCGCIFAFVLVHCQLILCLHFLIIVASHVKFSHLPITFCSKFLTGMYFVVNFDDERENIIFFPDENK